MKLNVVLVFSLFAVFIFAGCVQSVKEEAGLSPKLKQWQCSEDNRKADYTCVDVTFPVCAWYKDGSYKEAKNFCVACKDANVKYYTEQESGMEKVCP